MLKPYQEDAIFSIGFRRGGSWRGPLHAVWEVAFDPMSDDYTPEEMPASDLLELWAKKVRDEYPDGLIPIHWFVVSEEAGKHETMPFQELHGMQKYEITKEDFLYFYHWPIEVATGEPVNWLRLHVVDKLWNARRADKGGFIQEATGWKPAILQPFVYLPSLLSVRAEGTLSQD